jgi:hypothetical protein
MKIFRRRRRIEPSSNSSNTGQMMNLSLFIMLLAFFIVLNTLSSYEELKTEKVKRSIELAFSKDPEIEKSFSSATPDPAQAMREGHTFDRLDALFNAQVASFEAVQSKSQGVMMVQLPYKDFEEAIMAVGQKDLIRYPSRKAIRGNFFLPTLASILRTNIDGAPTRMEILINSNNNPAELQNINPKAMDAFVATASVFTKRLENQGMPQKLLNAGIQKGNPDVVNLVFRKYIPFSPVGRSEDAP